MLTDQKFAESETFVIEKKKKKKKHFNLKSNSTFFSLSLP